MVHRGALSAWPVAPPSNWIDHVNEPQTEALVEARGRHPPYRRADRNANVPVVTNGLAVLYQSVFGMEQRAGGVEPGHLFLAHSPHEDGLLPMTWRRPHLLVEVPLIMDLSHLRGRIAGGGGVRSHKGPAFLCDKGPSRSLDKK